jgi:HSP20 family molecular chaperone IbpA
MKLYLSGGGSEAFNLDKKLIEDIDTNTCSAEMKAGILKLTFQYKKEKKTKKIIIK